jgi:hypothetical protein
MVVLSRFGLRRVEKAQELGSLVSHNTTEERSSGRVVQRYSLIFSREKSRH